jgi:16S rRNA (guanine(966)-N(2))-methyltransferase RsmD
VLDLFAGSGSLGIEALSRGAERVDFVEANRDACRVLRENLDRLGFLDRATVTTTRVEHFLSSARQPYDLILMDAPYPDRVSASLLERLSQGDLLAKGGRVCVGHACSEALPDAVGILTRARLRRFGASCLSLYESTAPPASETD